MKTAFEKGALTGLHSVLVLRDGKVFLEAHFSGEDENWGRPLGIRHFNGDSLHDIRSITKSITGMLYGIALHEGIVPPVSASLVKQFDEYSDLQLDKDRVSITIGHALSMQMGTEWNENLPYTDPNNSEIAMENAEDRYRFILDRPLVTKPGTVWNYNGGATALIAKLIEKGSGLSLDQFAKVKLFEPLGIKHFEWSKGEDNVPSAASGLRLSIHDLAKIGQLILNDGMFDGKQVVPVQWLQTSFMPHAEQLEGPFRYGYFWWLAQGTPPGFVAGFGNGGKRLSINKKLGLVFVVYAGRYNNHDAWQLAATITTDFLIPALKLDSKN